MGYHDKSLKLLQLSSWQIKSYLLCQRVKKVSDSPGLVDFAFGLVNSVLNLPDRQVMFFEEFKLKKTELSK